MESIIVKQKNISKNTKQYFQYCFLFNLKPVSSFIDIEIYSIKFEQEIKNCRVG